MIHHVLIPITPHALHQTLLHEPVETLCAFKWVAVIIWSRGGVCTLMRAAMCVRVCVYVLVRVHISPVECLRCTLAAACTNLPTKHAQAHRRVPGHTSPVNRSSGLENCTHARALTRRLSSNQSVAMVDVHHPPHTASQCRRRAAVVTVSTRRRW